MENQGLACIDLRLSAFIRGSEFFLSLSARSAPISANPTEEGFG
jgi:hypothetical protein